MAFGVAHVPISIHALREEGDHARAKHINRHHNISIHALREEGDAADVEKAMAQTNFYPRPPRGGRLEPPYLGLGAVKFLSTPSARRAT